MTALYRLLVILLAGSLLASCGGGGSGDSGGGGGFTPQAITVSVTPNTTSTTPSSLVGVTVRVTGANGQALPNGTLVTLAVSPPGVGLVSAVQTNPPNVTTPVPLAESVQTPLAGGVAQFRLHSRAVGNATLTASVTDPAAPARTVSNSAVVAVTPGASTDPRLTLELQTTTLPLNPGVEAFPGSPFITEVVATWRGLDGQLVTATDEEDFCGVSVTGVGAFSTLDNGATEENEFTTLLGQGPVNVVAGRCIFYLHSFPFQSGTGTLTVSVVDQLTGETISRVVNFTQSSGASGLPGSVFISAGDEPVYIQGVNGAQSKTVQLFVFDGAGIAIPNAAAGVNNVRVEIVGGAQGGERLQSGSQLGGVVTARTINGIASVIYQSGTRSGLVTLRVTADRADNNVDNGIQDPVTSTRTITVSDGRLFDLDITSPFVNAVVVNPALGPDDDGVTIELPDGTTIVIPPAPDATYSLTVSVIATDRFGNPVPPGTEIRFGLIDHPQIDGVFQIAGNDGDPQEGGTLFTAPTGAFTTAGGGAGPNDTLIVFGEESLGNRDLESARTVQSINGPTSLTTTYRFNHNDDTGTIRNSGPVLPYVIGRATDGNVTVTAQTNALGVATTTMNYPTAKLGKRVVLWAQGAGDIVNGTPELITDAEFFRFAGLAPAILTANPNVIQANRTVPVQVCLTDALGNGIENAPISFVFTNLPVGTGSVNGIPSGGTLAQVTGDNGCVTANVTTAGIVGGDPENPPIVTFSSGGASAVVSIIPPGAAILTASPSSHRGGGPVVITLTLTDGNGMPINGTFITVTCETSDPQATLDIVDPPGTTGETGPGQTTATIDPSNFDTFGDDPPTGTCTFAPAGGEPSAIVTFVGIDQCDIGVSPPPPMCPPVP